MARETGTLSIHAENFLPIIKKWLYSDRDIFVRELISNGCDAIAKRRTLALTGEAEAEDGVVRVVADHDTHTLRFMDNGLGMTGEEVKKYINQVAFSGASEFLEKYKDNLNQIIGHFGLGFYSAFMVSEKVEIDTLSCQKGAAPVRWESDGGLSFTMEEGTRTQVGTTITLYLNEDAHDFLHEDKLREVITRYCQFMPTPIYLGEEKKETEGKEGEETDGRLNNPSPLYLKNPRQVTDEEYKSFYKETFHQWEDPLFWIHLNVDYPFNLKGILYFPRLNNEFGGNEGSVMLFANQVFVAENIKEVIPEYLLLLKGVIDCPDLPLNVSRSFLQNDGYVKRLSNHIAKKVGDKLKELFTKERETFDTYWDDIHPFIKYGCMKDDKFYENCKDCLVLKTTKGESLTHAALLEKLTGDEKNIYYTTDPKRQAATIALYEENDVPVVVLDTGIDLSYINFLEEKLEKTHFKRVDAALDEAMQSKDKQEINEDGLLTLCKEALSSDQIQLKVDTLKSKDVPAVLLREEFTRRYADASALWGRKDFMLPVQETLVLNAANDLIQQLGALSFDSETSKELFLQIYDMASMAQEPLKAERMTAFLQRNARLLSLLKSK